MYKTNHSFKQKFLAPPLVPCNWESSSVKNQIYIWELLSIRLRIRIYKNWFSFFYFSHKILEIKFELFRKIQYIYIYIMIFFFTAAKPNSKLENNFRLNSEDPMLISYRLSLHIHVPWNTYLAVTAIECWILISLWSCQA